MKKEIENKYGPQSAGDNPFTKKARLLQSYYRTDILMQAEFGRGPNKNSVDKIKSVTGELTGETKPTYYGNMLVNGEDTGGNFFFHQTFQYAKERVKNKIKEETIDEYRLFNNLLSSMPLAFNLFHPLMMIKDKYPKALNQMVKDAFPHLPIIQVEEIKIEFIPTPIEQYTKDKSAMDAAIIFQDENGDKHLIGIEVKYTDSLGTNKAKDNELKFDIAKNLKQFTNDGLKIIEDGCQQIYRNYLLIEKYKMVHGMKESYSIILAPKDHPSTNKEIETLKRHLKPIFHHKIMKSDLENFIEKLELNCPDEFKEWLNKFKNAT